MSRVPPTNDNAIAAIRRFTERQLGDFGEAIWSRVLAFSGFHCVSLTKICEGGAPLARNSGGNLILPDFDAYRDGRSVFVESKAKTRSIVYSNKKQERHGIDERNYLHYQEIERQSGKPCCIGIVELWREDVARKDFLYWSGSLLFEKLSDLIDPRSEHPEVPAKVYWRRKQFRDLHGGLSPVELFEIAVGKRQLSLRWELENILNPAHQASLF